MSFSYVPMVSPALLWLIAGAILCFFEAIFPVAFVAFMMGISAILVAAIALVISSFPVQVILWLALSTISIVVSRRFVPKKNPLNSLVGDAQEGETLTEITPGKIGRVLYEGNSWQAICADDTISISPHQKVYIVTRKGNTLVVLPEFLPSSIE
ncbi:putative nodulation efficiency protein, NfeD [Crocosphaera subtropica ATCC 51142]|uniref:Nodulation efficiency protein, NfeD n=1 Tax=Crocosphaera subtropica (strain ATCC 51142 / BH68) TaxID=43989 RepID=B1X0R4_CROS5|nr:NfeD family protein [Crocosphaera subtropica]ACB52953.1 putative nodulation efficiency protein, NfeD [Crocosphaera subtropica ATCC 51142]